MTETTRRNRTRSGFGAASNSIRRSPSPGSDLEVVQTLDTRKSSENKIFLEISAAGRGIVSRLDEVLDPTVPGYTVTKTNDRGVSISKIDTSRLPLSVLSEHLWTLELTFDPKKRGKAEMFRFPAVVRDDIEVVHRQYVDVDPVECGPEVPMTWLPFNYQKLIYSLVGGALVLGLLLVGIRLGKAFLGRERKFRPTPCLPTSPPSRSIPWSGPSTRTATCISVPSRRSGLRRI